MFSARGARRVTLYSLAIQWSRKHSLVFSSLASFYELCLNLGQTSIVRSAVESSDALSEQCIAMFLNFVAGWVSSCHWSGIAVLFYINFQSSLTFVSFDDVSYGAHHKYCAPEISQPFLDLTLRPFALVAWLEIFLLVPKLCIPFKKLRHLLKTTSSVNIDLSKHLIILCTLFGRVWANLWIRSSSLHRLHFRGPVVELHPLRIAHYSSLSY